ncbi:MAG: hypothetical protein ACLP01_13410 [Solirubrobacteraceae bacterium]
MRRAIFASFVFVSLVLVSLALAGSSLGATLGQAGDFSTPTAGSFPSGIVAGPGRQHPVHGVRRRQIGEIDPVTHTITEFATPTELSGPLGIAVGQDGNIWFTEFHGHLPVREGDRGGRAHRVGEAPAEAATDEDGCGDGRDRGLCGGGRHSGHGRARPELRQGRACSTSSTASQAPSR